MVDCIDTLKNLMDYISEESDLLNQKRMDGTATSEDVTRLKTLHEIIRFVHKEIV